MAVLRYAHQERANIKKAESRAIQQSRLNASLAQRAAEEEATALFGDAASVASVPASSTATGTTGQVAADATYLYYCYDTNLWGRIAFDATPW